MESNTLMYSTVLCRKAEIGWRRMRSSVKLFMHPKMHGDVPGAWSMTEGIKFRPPHGDGRTPPPDSKSGGVRMERPYQQNLGLKARGKFSCPATCAVGG